MAATICVLVVAAGAAWESRALAALGARPGVLVLKRCVDVDDLLASATAGQAHVAVVALDAPGLDAAAIEHLRRHQVRPVAVVAGGIAEADRGRLRAHRIGVAALVAEGDLGTLGQVVSDERPEVVVAPLEQTPLDDEPPEAEPGRVVVVWGPQGAPGRTTVAAGLAGVLAARGAETVLVDADPYGGAVAQHLGVLDEVSGVLSAARLAAAGALVERLASVPRSLGPRLSVVTGLPRPERWIEVRAGAVEHLVEALREHAHVVVDTGLLPRGGPGHRLRHPAGAQRHDPRCARGRRRDRGRRHRPTPSGSRGSPEGWSSCARSSTARRCAWSSTGTGRRWAGPSATSPGWSRASPGSRACTCFPTTGRRSTGPWSPGAPSSSRATPRCCARWRAWRTPSYPPSVPPPPAEAGGGEDVGRVVRQYVRRKTVRPSGPPRPARTGVGAGNGGRGVCARKAAPAIPGKKGPVSLGVSGQAAKSR